MVFLEVPTACPCALLGLATVPFVQAWPSYTTAFAKERDEHVELVAYAGRLGNSLHLMPGAITWAEHLGKPFVKFPSAPKDRSLVEDFVTLPDLLPVQPRKLPWGDCAGAACFASADAMLRDHRRVMLKYIKPLLRHTFDAFRMDEDKDKDELIIHLRSGDAMSAKNQLCRAPYNLPPCAYYDEIIRKGNAGSTFRHVRIITESDMENPCVNTIRQRHPHAHVVVQSRSREEDAAALLNARFLAAAPSLFSKMLSLMNERLHTVWIVEGSVDAPAMRPGFLPCGEPGEARVVQLRVPGMCQQWEDADHKKRWMVSYPAADVSTARVCDARTAPRPQLLHTPPEVQALSPHSVQDQDHVVETSRSRSRSRTLVTFENRGDHMISVFSVEAQHGLEVFVGKVDPGREIVFPAHDGREFRFRQGGRLSQMHLVDQRMGGKQRYAIGHRTLLDGIGGRDMVEIIFDNTASATPLQLLRVEKSAEGERAVPLAAIASGAVISLQATHGQLIRLQRRGADFHWHIVDASAGIDRWPSHLPVHSEL